MSRRAIEDSLSPLSLTLSLSLSLSLCGYKYLLAFLLSLELSSWRLLLPLKQHNKETTMKCFKKELSRARSLMAVFKRWKMFKHVDSGGKERSKFIPHSVHLLYVVTFSVKVRRHLVGGACRPHFFA